MKAEELTDYYRSGHPCTSAGYLRFILMFFVCFWNFGFPEPTGYVMALSGFAAPAFFILSGYFVMSPNKEQRTQKISRKIKRTFLWFICLFACYLLINVAVCLINHISVKLSLRIVFNFFVLNLWPLPVGTGIWFVQALLYAYIVIYIVDKLHLFKFYKILLVLTILVMLLSGELSGAIRFDLLGYSYIPGNWLTRALPYILLGVLMREKTGVMVRIPTIGYLSLLVLGGIFALIEIKVLAHYNLLIYEGHMIGYGVMAFAVCGWAVTHPIMKRSLLTAYDPAISGLIYSVMEPLYYIAGLIVIKFAPVFYLKYGGLVILALSAAIAILLCKTPVALLFFGKRKPTAASAPNKTQEE